jgi:hypothetical protein
VWQNVELPNVKLVVHIVTTGPLKADSHRFVGKFAVLVVFSGIFFFPLEMFRNIHNVILIIFQILRAVSVLLDVFWHVTPLPPVDSSSQEGPACVLTTVVSVTKHGASCHLYCLSVTRELTLCCCCY